MSSPPARRRRLLVPAVAGALALSACTDDTPDPAPEASEQPSEEDDRDVDELLDPEEADDDGEPTEDEDGAEDDIDEELLIEPGTMLGPGAITTVVGDGIEVTFELSSEVEGGTVAPGDLPLSLELVPQGGAIVVFEAVGHTRADLEDEEAPHHPEHGLPDDLHAWLTTDLPGEVEVTDGPTDIQGGIAVTLHNEHDEDSMPIVLWSAQGEEVVEELEGHGPPPEQTQHLWLRELDGHWLGVVTYGSELDRDLAAEIALSLRIE